MTNVKHTGGCHCGDVRFEVTAPAHVDVINCNCSICAATGFQHLIVKDTAFSLLTPWENLTSYKFNTKTADHLFCKTCGIKSFYKPRSHPDGWSVNFKCLDEGTVKGVNYRDFDGVNWEQNIDRIN